ncbi:TolC family protein [Neisseriaceae bacterium JH1-16]|nr:TolC family protein [Neisseriaceae bacterium JH1-16]
MIPLWKRLPLPLLLAGLAPFVHADVLTFGRALDLAERQSPLLQANIATINAAQHETVAAGRLPDPKLVFGVDNYPVSGPMKGSLEGDFMTMQKVGVMQDIPSSAKRQAQTELASANVTNAEAQRRVVRLKVRVAAAQAWLNRFYLERKLSVFDQLARENITLTGAIRAQVASGRSEAVDAIQQKQEGARLEDRRDELRRDIAKATASLRQSVGAEADSSLAGDAPTMPLDAGLLRNHLHTHPELQAFSAQQGVAEADLHAAQAEKNPDWGIELDYQKRGAQFGNMVSLQVTVGLPLFGETRQDPMIAAKAEQLNRVEAEREAMRRDHAAEQENDLAERDMLDRQLQRIREQQLPLAEQRVALQTASYRAGKASLASVLSARRDRLDEELKAIDLQNQAAAVTAKLYFAYGAGAQ